MKLLILLYNLYNCITRRLSLSRAPAAARDKNVYIMHVNVFFVFNFSFAGSVPRRLASLISLICCFLISRKWVRENFAVVARWAYTE